MGRVLLELDLTEAPGDAVPTDPVGYVLAKRRPTLRGVVTALTDAAGDPHVAGLVAKVGGPLPLARAQELRDAVRRFAATGKPAVAWAETFGEGEPATVPYLLATGFGEVWLQPSGDLGLTGIAAEATFLRGALDKLGLEPQLSQRYEYKNAVDRLTATGFTDAYREAAGRLAASALEQVVTAVAQARGLTPQRVRELVDEAPLPAEQALAAGLVDRLGYRDEVYASLAERTGGAELLFLGRYRKGGTVRRLLPTVRRKKAVALVSVLGGISRGRSRRGPLSPSGGAGSDTVAAALRAAGRADDIGGVVLRVDSPGGSYVASDVIWREVHRLREQGKPVVASMGDVAASGGYFVAMAADAIVAQPGTITGSIGVFSGKLVTAGLLDKLGIGSDAVVEGRHARMFSPRVGFDAEQWQRLEEWLDRVYDDFVGKVAEARGLTRERAHELARGRVWTGADAHERGLVDELGGLDRAVELVAERAGLKSPQVRRWPRRTAADLVRTPKSSDAAALAGGWAPGRVAGDVAADLAAELAADLAARLGRPPEGPLTLGPLRLR